jgi:hypothetical protein
MLHGWGITIFPMSWGLGIWRRPTKTLFALGPVLFVKYRLANRGYRSY